jgi:hypothetical protein
MFLPLSYHDPAFLTRIREQGRYGLPPFRNYDIIRHSVLSFHI